MEVHEQHRLGGTTTVREAIEYFWYLIPLPLGALLWWARSDYRARYGTQGVLAVVLLVYAVTSPLAVMIARRHRKQRQAALLPPLLVRDRLIQTAIAIVAWPVPAAAFLWWIEIEGRVRFGMGATALYFLAVTMVALCAVLVLKRFAGQRSRA